MSTIKRLTADLLLGVQIAAGLLIVGSQIIRSFSSTQGLSIAMYFLMVVFFGLNLILAIHAHKNKPSRITRQMVGVYAFFAILCSALIIVVFCNNPSIWDKNETVISIIAIVGAGVVIAFACLRKIALANPMVKAWLAIAFKGVPQVAQAYKLFLVGGAGLTGGAILGGHLTVLTRLGQLVFSIREAGWDKNRWASFWSELVNWLTWVLVTIVWFLV